MLNQPTIRGAASGNIRRVRRKRGDQWYIQARLPDGRQIQKRLGPAWGGPGRPPNGYFTKRTAEQALRHFLADADRGLLPAAPARTEVTLADAAEEWLRFVGNERGVKHSTLGDYRSQVVTHINPAFGEQCLDAISKRDIQRWQSRLADDGKLSARSRNKLLTIVHGIFARARDAYGLAVNPVEGVEHPRERYSEDTERFSPEEVFALARAAETEQDGALFITAAFSGMRQGELLALRWRDVDFANRTIRVRESLSHGVLTTPKGRRVRSVPMVKPVAGALARLGQRGILVGEDDLVFPGLRSAQKVNGLLDAEDYSEAQDEILVADYLDRSALLKRYNRARKAAGLNRKLKRVSRGGETKMVPLTFHDLRHTFGSEAINHANLVEVQAHLGHADLRTTMRYLHFRQRGDEADRLSRAFEPEAVGTEDAGESSILAVVKD
jgi:integrase